MSWFEFTNLAKTALKEAQKKIDRALDIKEEGEDGVKSTKMRAESTSHSNVQPSVANEMSGSIELASSTTGSFFENPNANEMITTAPKAISSTEIVSAPSNASLAATSNAGEKRQSITSNSASIDLLSPSISTCSDAVSGSESAVCNSESVDLIATTATNDVITPDSGSSLPESIVIITNKDGYDDEEDSLSYNTLVNESVVDVATEEVCKQQPSIEDVNQDDSTQNAELEHSNSSTSTSKMLLSMENINYESDSTHSFEDVQIQASSLQSSFHKQTSEPNSIVSNPASHSHTSPHNSNDEMDTTTSSDIEIISNPNGGDSSSTNSMNRTSPLKYKKLTKSQATLPTCENSSKKGHYREPSEISVLSEDSQSEIDRLMHRISELNEILESRELKLLQCERQNSALQEKNNVLQTTVDAMKGNAVHLDSAEEYTQRLSALEKKFQTSIRERDALRIQIKALKDELKNKIPKEDLTQVVTEKDAMISELRLEGEKLSKEILQQSNIIKKLRTKEKENLKNKEQILQLQDETERLKKTLNVKEDVERTQIEAVHKMSSERRKLIEENEQLRSKVEDLQAKTEALQSNYDAVKIELENRTRLHSDLNRTAEEAAVAKKENEQQKAQNQELMMQISELREKLKCAEQTMAKKEQHLREENKQLLKRLEDAELRAESSAHDISLTTTPLMRQLESLQNTLSQRTTNWNKEEKLLLQKIDQNQVRLQSLEIIERGYEEEIELLKKCCRDLEAKVALFSQKEERLRLSLQQNQSDFELKVDSLNSQITLLNKLLEDHKNQIKALEVDKKNLEEKMRSINENQVCQKSNILTHANVSALELDENEGAGDGGGEGENQSQQPLRGYSPPISSWANNSIDDIVGSIDWQNDGLDSISNSGRYGSTTVLGTHVNFTPYTASTLEHLQSLLKQRDGELTHVQWELSRLHAERGVLNEEICNLTIELENMKEKLQSMEEMEKNFDTLQNRYDALLQMYGEKVERTEELELDIIELKEAYKAQIDELLKQPKPTI